MKLVKKKSLSSIGIFNIKTTFNNTIITVTDSLGNTICWTSSGTVGYKGAKKKTALAAQKASYSAVIKVIEVGIKNVKLIFNGYGNGRESILYVLTSNGLKIIAIIDKIILPHNGCRPPKKRWL